MALEQSPLEERPSRGRESLRPSLRARGEILSNKTKNEQRVGERISLLWYRANQEILSRPLYLCSNERPLFQRLRGSFSPLEREERKVSKIGVCFSLLVERETRNEQKQRVGFALFARSQRERRGSMALQRAPGHRGGEQRESRWRESLPLDGLSSSGLCPNAIEPLVGLSSRGFEKRPTRPLALCSSKRGAGRDSLQK
jgi:hypothetical protein